ncbi:hypothetical protein ACJMK2_002930, partial [Sinanodonta woodiana]
TTETTIATANPQLICNTGYSLYSGPGRNFCYRYFTLRTTWDDAQMVCRMDNADLLILDDENLMPFSNIMVQQVT